MTWGFIALGIYAALAVPFGLYAWALCRVAAQADRDMEKEDEGC